MPASWSTCATPSTIGRKYSSSRRGNSKSTSPLFSLYKGRAARRRTKPYSLITCSTRERVGHETSARPFKTFETVGTETPAICAICAIVMRSSVLCLFAIASIASLFLEIFDLFRHLYDNMRVGHAIYKQLQLHIQIGAPGVAFDEATARAYFVAHQHVEDFVSLQGFFDRYLQDSALGRVHRGFPERFGVHFTQTFVATNLWFLAVMLLSIFLDQRVALLFCVDEACLLVAHLNVVERRLRNIEMALLDQQRHMAEEEGQQQGANVGTIDVGIAHNHDASVAQTGYVELLTDTGADGRDNILDLGIFEHLINAGTFDIQNFTTQRENCLEMPVASLFCASTCRVTFYEVEFAAVGTAFAAIGQLAGQRGVQSVLALHQFTRGTRSFARTRREQAFLDNRIRLTRRLFQVASEHIGSDGFHDGPHFGIVQFRLGLRLKLWIGNLDAHHSSQALTHVIAGQIAVLLFENIVFTRVVVQRAG